MEKTIVTTTFRDPAPYESGVQMLSEGAKKACSCTVAQIHITSSGF